VLQEEQRRGAAAAALARFQARPQMAVSAPGPVPMAPMAPVSTANMGIVGPGMMRHAVAIAHPPMHLGNMNMMRPVNPMGIHPGKRRGLLSLFILRQ